MYSHVAVLLIEDDDDHATRLTDALENALDGAVVSRARSVESAAELAHTSSWSIAIVDSQLPEGHGMTILDSLHAQYPAMPIVMLTGEGSENVAIEAFRRGASDYVVKTDEYLDALTARVRGLVPS